MNKERLALAAISIVGGLLACLASGLIGAALSSRFGTSNYTISYADFISIMLTGVTVLLACLAIVLAILGVIGWNAITTRVGNRTEAYLEDGFKKGNHLYRQMENKINEITYAGVVAVGAESDESQEGESVAG